MAKITLKNGYVRDDFVHLDQATEQARQAAQDEADRKIQEALKKAGQLV